MSTYTKTAPFYDLIYSRKDYEKEAAAILSMVKKHNPGAIIAELKLLDAACGTGGHLAYFEKHVQTVGVDASKDMLAVAQSKLQRSTLKRQSLQKLDLNESFDVITCLFTSFSYLQTVSDMRASLLRMRNLLRDGGQIYLELWSTKSEFNPEPWLHTYQSPESKVVRLITLKKRKQAADLIADWLIAKSGQPTRHLRETHRLRFYDPKEMSAIAYDAGLSSKEIHMPDVFGRRHLLVLKKR